MREPFYENSRVLYTPLIFDQIITQLSANFIRLKCKARKSTWNTEKLHLWNVFFSLSRKQNIFFNFSLTKNVTIFGSIQKNIYTCNLVLVLEGSTLISLFSLQKWKLLYYTEALSCKEQLFERLKLASFLDYQWRFWFKAIILVCLVFRRFSMVLLVKVLLNNKASILIYLYQNYL